MITLFNLYLQMTREITIGVKQKLENLIVKDVIIIKKTMLLVLVCTIECGVTTMVLSVILEIHICSANLVE